MKYFIAGTDTEVGKTYVTILLSKYFKSKNYNVGVFKPIESGVGGNDTPDYKLIAKAAGDIEKPLYILSKPLAPYIAANYDNKKINCQKILEYTTKDSVNYDIYFVEGAGGLFVPIEKDYLLIDLIKDIGFEVILVCRTNLGTVNHTLLSIEAMENRNIKIKDIILNEIVETSEKSILENIEMIELFSDYKIRSIIKHNKNFNQNFDYLLR